MPRLLTIDSAAAWDSAIALAEAWYAGMTVPVSLRRPRGAQAQRPTRSLHLTDEGRAYLSRLREQSGG